MDDSDDYVFDDIVFDAQALAVLDQEEKKYLQNTLHSTQSPTVLEEPINKRHKTNSGWKPGLGAATVSSDAYDDLPEISLQGDGSYGVRGHGMGNAQYSAGHVAPPASRNVDLPYKNVFNNKIAHSTSAFPRNPPNAQASGSRALNTRQASSANTRQSFQNKYSMPQEQHNPVQSRANAPELQNQMLDLQKKLDELREENARIQASLKEAVDIKLAKEGEVSILRKNIEKASQNHAAQILHLKTEKEQVEVKQAQVQKDMKEELERLRSQMVFKQQELESTMMRKIPGSVRAKKVGREYPSTPLAVPPSMSSWNRDRGASQVQMSTGIGDETPLRPSRMSHNLKQSPSKQPLRSTEKSRKAILPGFQNAFEPSALMPSPSKRLTKGKNKADPDCAVFGGGISQISYVPSQQTGASSHSQFHAVESRTQAKSETENLPVFSVPFGSEISQVNSEDMDMVPTEGDEDPQTEGIETFDPINWKSELCRIILTHCDPITGQIVLQQLVSSAEHTKIPKNYTAACSRILEVISNPTRTEDLRGSIQVLCNSLLLLLEALCDCQQFHSLSMLLNLLTRLILSLPMFQPILLSSVLSTPGNGKFSIIDIVCNIILQNLEPTKSLVHDHEVAAELLSLLELLCFRIPQESINLVEAFAKNHKVTLLLLHASQPPWLLEKSIMLLTLLSTHHNLFRFILGINATAGGEREEEEPIKNPFVERLCSHLIDSNKAPTENFKIYTLTLLSQLSIAHPDGYATLVGSNALIPSLVLYISHLTTPLWEEDELLVSSREMTYSYVRALNQTTLLLYHLIFGTDPCLNLRYKLQHAPHRPFNSISHVFVVTFGRLSYCDPPSWIDPEVRQDLEFLAEIARDILEVVVDGPEGDSVWAAFQTEPDEESALDEEEMEARLVGIDR